MSKKPRKQTAPASSRLGKKASGMLNEIVSEVGLTKTKAVEKAIERFYTNILQRCYYD